VEWVEKRSKQLVEQRRQNERDKNEKGGGPRGQNCLFTGHFTVLNWKFQHKAE
jgi:hypothetical protein